MLFLGPRLLEDSWGKLWHPQYLYSACPVPGRDGIHSSVWNIAPPPESGEGRRGPDLWGAAHCTGESGTTPQQLPSPPGRGSKREEALRTGDNTWAVDPTHRGASSRQQAD